MMYVKNAEHHTRKTKPVIESIIEHGGEPYFVGGCVRDLVMGFDPADFDIEVYGINKEVLEQALHRVGIVNAVGKSFGVYKVTLPESPLANIDVSIPRRENKVGQGHKGFIPEPDPTMQPVEAAARRDFTMNSMFMSPMGFITDPFGGMQDIKNKILKPTSTAFMEDPLRVLRGMQFAARFDMKLSTSGIFMAQEMIKEYRYLSIERIASEWHKLFTQGVHFDKAINLLLDTHWISLYPSLQAIVGLPQDLRWHPEGDVLKHTALVMNEACQIVLRRTFCAEERFILVLAALCHDFGKATTTVYENDGSITSRGHDRAGIEPSLHFMAQIGVPGYIQEKVIKLVAEHMSHIGMAYERGIKTNNPTLRQIRRLSDRLFPATIEQWADLIEADHSGRPPLPKERPEVIERVVERAKELRIERNKPEKILTGQDIRDYTSLLPGPIYKTILDWAYELQLDGELDESNKIELLLNYVHTTKLEGKS